ncbi:NYN domain-containing protein [Bradyrhizobium sp.]|uniref:LabA-like NYN domain-containing protein n=1 Tax=Bradyrhizobium sp. TaxID=376 RepID=UPI0025C14BA0|nr:NYN domain-containing protein [Bradyrhizobium sp.]
MRANKLGLFIDGINLHATARSLGFDIDFKRLLAEFCGRGTLLRAFYYTTILEDQEYSSVRPLIDWLGYNGYTVVTKTMREFIDTDGRRKVKGNLDIELTVHAMEFARHIDQMVLFSGDRDFRSLVQAVQRRGVRVTVISTIASQPQMIADELRRQADDFIDLTEMRSRIARDSHERHSRAESRDRPQFSARAAGSAAGEQQFGSQRHFYSARHSDTQDTPVGDAD